MEAGIDSLPPAQKEDAPTYVLYLPENELHELGLLYAHFVLRCQGNKVIYLGQCVPRADLAQLAAMVTGNIRFLTIITASPLADKVAAYLQDLRKLLPDPRLEFVIAGSQVSRAELKKLPEGFTAHTNMKDMLEAMVA
jgi:methylmalonyl-CoA mutase cobalamin-binding subunit